MNESFGNLLSFLKVFHIAVGRPLRHGKCARPASTRAPQRAPQVDLFATEANVRGVSVADVVAAGAIPIARANGRVVSEMQRAGWNGSAGSGRSGCAGGTARGAGCGGAGMGGGGSRVSAATDVCQGFTRIRVGESLELSINVLSVARGRPFWVECDVVHVRIAV